MGQRLSGEEVLPDSRAIAHILSDLSSDNRDISTPDLFNSYLSGLPDEAADFSLRAQKIFQDPESINITQDALDKTWSIEGQEISNPFSVSPGAKYLSAIVKIFPRKIKSKEEGFEFPFNASISAPGLLIPRKPSLAPLCDALVRLSSNDYLDLEDQEQHVLTAFLAKQKVDRGLRSSSSFLSEIGFAVRILAENIGLITKPYPCDSGEAIQYFIDGEEDIGLS